MGKMSEISIEVDNKINLKEDYVEPTDMRELDELYSKINLEELLERLTKRIEYYENNIKEIRDQMSGFDAETLLELEGDVSHSAITFYLKQIEEISSKNMVEKIKKKLELNKVGYLK